MLNKLQNSSILFLLFLLPIIPATANKGYEEIKVLSLLYGTIILAVFLAVRIATQKTKLIFSKIHIYQVLFLLTLLVTSFTGINPEQSLLGGSPYFQGWITFLFLTILSAIISFTKIKRSYLINTIILSAVIVSVFALSQYIQLQSNQLVPNYAGRVVSTFGQPNFYAGFLLLILPFLLEKIKKTTPKKEQLFNFSLLIIILAAIAVSFSRTAIILTGIILSLWLIQKLIKSVHVKIALLIFILIGFSYALIPSRLLQDELIQPLTKQTVEYSNAQKRIFIWQASIEEIKKSPLLGFGLENIANVFPKEYDFNHPKPAFYHSLKDLTIDNTHNLFLNLLLWGGVLCLLTFILLIVYLLRQAENLYFKATLIIFLFWALIQNLSIIHWLIFYLLTAIIAKGSIDTNNSKKVLLESAQ